jgi:hypothetical protein
MQYTLLIYNDEADWERMNDDERRAVYGEYGELIRDLRAQGKMLGGEQLQSVATATSVRVRDGDALVADGPFTETKEVLCGFFLIDAESLDEALDWAARVPGAQRGTVEVRPIVETPGNGA